MLSITRDRVAKYHEKLNNEHEEAYANLAMRIPFNEEIGSFS